MDYFIARCVRYTEILMKIHDKCKLRKILDDDEYSDFMELFSLFYALYDSQIEKMKKSEVRKNGKLF